MDVSFRFITHMRVYLSLSRIFQSNIFCVKMYPAWGGVFSLSAWTGVDIDKMNL